MKTAIATLNNNLLKTRFERLARTERKITALVIEYISEISKRELYLRWGYPSLFEYLVSAMGYSESAAYRRIQAARAFRQIPEIKEALEDGSLKLSQVSQVQTALRKEEQATGAKIPIEARIDLFSEVAGKSGAATQRILDKHLVHQTQSKPQEVHKCDESVELTLKLSKEAFAQLTRVKELYSHVDPFADWVKIVELMMKDVCRKRDPLAQLGKTRISGGKVRRQSDPKAAWNARAEIDLKAASQDCNNRKDRTARSPLRPHGGIIENESLTRGFAATEVEIVHLTPDGVPIPPKRQAIPAQTRRLIFQRDRGQCQFRGSTGILCGSRFQTEIDHILPVHAGGTNDGENLRLLCRSHNGFRERWHA